MSTQNAPAKPRVTRAYERPENEPTDKMHPTTEQVARREQLSALERTLSTNSPILASLLLQLPTSSIFQLYHASPFLRRLLQTCPIAWKHLSFRLAAPSIQMTNANAPDDGVGSPRPSKNYALDQLLLRVVNPFSSNLKSLELDNTAVSGQILTSTVLLLRRETLEHLSVRGCKNVSLKYHLNPYLNVFGLQHEAAHECGAGDRPMARMALKSLYTYRCRHHRRRPYLPSSLSRRDSDSEPTHELVTLCHKLGIWTDTAWCTTPGNRCYRRRNYVQMRVPNGTSEVWVVFDRLWRSRNWIGPPDGTTSSATRDGRSWEQEEYARDGEALGFNRGKRLQEGKATPAHLRASHRDFVERITCDSCGDAILERCEQCSVLMHCAGCRKTLCASCAYDRPYAFRRPAAETISPDAVWWAPGHTVNPCVIAEPPPALPANGAVPLPSLRLRWCCTQPIFSGGGGMSFAPGIVRDAERVRAAPLPRGQGWEDPEFSAIPTAQNGSASVQQPPHIPERLSENDRANIINWLLGPPGRNLVECPRNLCTDCYDSETWRVHCKACSKPLCMEHDLRGLKLRICGLKDLNLEKMAVREQHTRATSMLLTHAEVPRITPDGPVTSALQLNPNLLLLETAALPPAGEQLPAVGIEEIDGHGVNGIVSSASGTTDSTLQVPLHHPLPSRPLLPLLSSPTSSVPARPPSVGSIQTVPSRTSSPASLYQEPAHPACATPTPTPPTWTGCLSFFCSSFRTHGDMRPRCPSINFHIKECASCSTFVCTDCIASSPIPITFNGCKCSSCQNAFFCPNCMGKRLDTGECRRVEEEKREREERERRERLAEEEKRGREKSDWVMGIVGEFWEQMEDEGKNDEDNSEEAEEVDIAGILRRHVPRLGIEAAA